ncbi:MAG: hypothetical protein Q4F07_07190 [Bacteroidales bacterium]|nr:hypothetical protein [Bacteroidales bacterium]
MSHANDITEFFISLIDTHRSIDVAEAEFKRIVADDDDLQQQYKDWCDENGFSIRNGFSDFAEDYLEKCDSIWDSLNDYDDNE